MDVNQSSRRARGVSRAGAPVPPQQQQAATPSVEPKAAGKGSSWKHDLHRSFAAVRLDLAPSTVHVWEIMWDHLPSLNQPFRLSHGTIAREGCIHRTAAARATAELVERGLIVCIHRGHLGSQQPNIWRFPQALPAVPKRPRRPPPKSKPT